jgi:hypothetical protein
MKKFRNLFSFLNLHIAGVALLLILNLVLGVRLFLAWSTLRAAGADQLQQQQTAYRALQLEMSPLRGLPQKVSLSRTQADGFYTARFPNAYSTISARPTSLIRRPPRLQVWLSCVWMPASAGSTHRSCTLSMEWSAARPSS